MVFLAIITFFVIMGAVIGALGNFAKVNEKNPENLTPARRAVREAVFPRADFTPEQEAEYSQYRQNKAILDMLRYK
jgi:hypothetical protein